MTLTWRPLRPLEVDHEALWLLVGSASLCLLGVALATPGIQLPRCGFKTITGLPCPTCGLTRTIIALSRGDLDRALFINPLAAIACGAGLLYLLYAARSWRCGCRASGRQCPRPARDACGSPRSRPRLNWLWLIATGTLTSRVSARRVPHGMIVGCPRPCRRHRARPASWRAS